MPAVSSKFIFRSISKQAAIGIAIVSSTTLFFLVKSSSFWQGSVFGAIYHFAVAAPEMRRIENFYKDYNAQLAIQEANDEKLFREKIQAALERKAARESSE